MESNKLLRARANVKDFTDLCEVVTIGLRAGKSPKELTRMANRIAKRSTTIERFKSWEQVYAYISTMREIVQEERQRRGEVP